MRWVYALFILMTYVSPVKADSSIAVLKANEEKLRPYTEKVFEEIKENLTGPSEVVYEFKTDDRPCQHCPEYINLTSEVNRIVAKVPLDVDTPRAYNESLIKLNKLRFMYYEVKTGLQNGGVQCVQYANTDSQNLKLTSQENIKLLAEEVLSLPDITSFQYYPQGTQKEIKYYYRGVGMQSDVLIEVSVFPDRTAFVRYYRMTDFGTPSNLKDKTSSKDKALSVSAISQDFKFVKPDNTEVTIADKLKVNADPTTVKLSEQKVALSLKNATDGKDWVKLDVHHNTNKDVSFSTFVPLEWKLNGGKLKMSGALEYGSTRSYEGENLKERKAATFALTDHNNEYLKATVVSQFDVDQLTVSSNYNVGRFGHIKGSVFTDSNGTKEYKLGHGFKGDNSVTTTTVGMTADAKKFFELQREQRIGKSQSMVLTLRTDEDLDTTILYQYKFKMR